MFKNRVYRYWHYLKFGYREVGVAFSLINFLLIIGLYFVLNLPILIMLAIVGFPILIVLGWGYIKGGPQMVATKAQLKHSALTQIHLHVLHAQNKVLLNPTADNYKLLHKVTEKCEKEWLLIDY